MDHMESAQKGDNHLQLIEFPGYLSHACGQKDIWKGLAVPTQALVLNSWWASKAWKSEVFLHSNIAPWVTYTHGSLCGPAVSPGSWGGVSVFWNSGKLLSNDLKNDRLPHVPTVLEEAKFPWWMASLLCTMPFKIFFSPTVSQTKECFQFLRLYLPSLSLEEALSLAFWWLCTYFNTSDWFQLLPLCSRKLTHGNALPRSQRTAAPCWPPLARR